MTARTKLATLNGAHTEGASSPRRRTWGTQERQRIVDAALAPGASVAEVARLNGLNANLVFKWIRRSREGWLDRRRGPRAGLQAVVIVDETPAFVPVQIFEAPKTAAALPAPVEVEPPKARHVVRKGARSGGMEISLPNGARVAIDADFDAGALRLLLAALGDL